MKPATIKPTLTLVNGKPTTTTRQIAQFFNKRHGTVLRALENLDCSEYFTEHNFAVSEYQDSTGRTCKEYILTKNGFAFLCMGFTGKEAAKWKEAYIGEFDRMETALAPKPSEAATPEQSQHIKSLVNERVRTTGKTYSAVWNEVFDAAGFNKLDRMTETTYRRALEWFNPAPKAAPQLEGIAQELKGAYWAMLAELDALSPQKGFYSEHCNQVDSAKLKDCTDLIPAMHNAITAFKRTITPVHTIQNDDELQKTKELLTDYLGNNRFSFSLNENGGIHLQPIDRFAYNLPASRWGDVIRAPSEVATRDVISIMSACAETLSSRESSRAMLR